MKVSAIPKVPSNPATGARPKPMNKTKSKVTYFISLSMKTLSTDIFAEAQTPYAIYNYSP